MIDKTPNAIVVRGAPGSLEELLRAALADHQAGRLPAAEVGYRKILAADPRHAAALHFLGLMAYQSGDCTTAVGLMDRAVEIDASKALYRFNLGLVLQGGGNLEEAAAAYRHAINIEPNFADAHSNLGAVLLELGNWEEAILACEAALRLNSGHAEAHTNLCAALRNIGRLEEALVAVNTAIALKPGYPQAHANRGGVLTVLGRLEDAITAFDAALRLRPEFPEVHYNQAFAHFLSGDLGAGWPKYEWRWRGGDRNLKPRGFGQPQWQGENIAGQSILLHGEQGMGDSIQFCRYVACVAARGAQSRRQSVVFISASLPSDKKWWLDGGCRSAVQSVGGHVIFIEGGRRPVPMS